MDRKETIKITESEESVSRQNALEGATVVVASSEKENGSGVAQPIIDRAEWNKIIAEVDAKQKEEEKNAKKQRKHPVLRRVFIIFFALILCFCLAAFIYISKIIKETPEINPNNLYDLLSENSKLLDKDGELIDYIYEGTSLRTNVEYKDIPRDMIYALVCTEDKNFFTHGGFDLGMMLKAVLSSAKNGFKTPVSGAATITIQLARNIYLPESKSSNALARRIQEVYYARLLEKSLTKEQILEAYFNTIYLGFNSDGIQAASQVYFSKNVNELTTVECAMLAAIPQMPNAYSPLKRVATAEIEDAEELDIISKNESWTIYYNDAIEERALLILSNMNAQGKLSDEDLEYYQSNIHSEIRNCLNPSETLNSAYKLSSYFTDYVIDQVINDLQLQLGYTEQEAKKMVYSGGLSINSTLDRKIQTMIEDKYANNTLFPDAANSADYGWMGDNTVYDGAGNMINSASGKIKLYKKSNMFSEIVSENGESSAVFALRSDEYAMLEDGSMIIYSGNRLNFYKTQVGENTDYSMEFKPFYERNGGLLYTSTGGYILIPSEYKIRDNDGNMIITSDFFKIVSEETGSIADKYLSFNEDGSVSFSLDCISVNEEIIQPQSAFVVIENTSGHIVAMIGGRESTGSNLKNRSIDLHNPGTALVPLSIYSAVLQKSYDNAKLNAQDGGKRIVYTAASLFDDIPTVKDGRLWPINYDPDPRYDNKCLYRGRVSLRKSLANGINTVAINLYNSAVSSSEVINQLQRLGITSLVLSGTDSDVNAESLALGELNGGVSLLEMCEAYACIANYGSYNSASCYTTVTNSNGDVILSSQTNTNKAMDEETASLLINLLQSSISEGNSGNAFIYSQSCGGSLGITTSNQNMWFCGITPKYTASLWIGSDNDLYLDGKSADYAASLWSSVMEGVGAIENYKYFHLKNEYNFVYETVDSKTGKLPVSGKGEGIDTPSSNLVSELFIAGTQPTASDENGRATVEICLESGYLATPQCREAGCTGIKNCVDRPGGMSWESVLSSYRLDMGIGEKGLLFNRVYDFGSDIPDYYCPIHNSDRAGFPVSPLCEYTDYDTSGAKVIDKEPVGDEDEPQGESPDDAEEEN